MQKNLLKFIIDLNKNQTYLCLIFIYITCNFIVGFKIMIYIIFICKIIYIFINFLFELNSSMILNIIIKAIILLISNILIFKIIM